MEDFNILFQKQNDPHAILLRELLEEYSYAQIVPPLPTQISGNTLDLILVSNDLKDKIKDVQIDSLVTLSDHYLISCTLASNITVEDTKHKLLEYRRFSSLNTDVFKEEIRKTNIFNVDCDTFSSIDDATLYYNQTLQCILDKLCPVIKKKIFNKHEAWFDEELRECRRRRRKAERALRKKNLLHLVRSIIKDCVNPLHLLLKKNKRSTIMMQ